MYYDADLRMLYVTGRGDSIIHSFEYQTKFVPMSNNSKDSAIAKVAKTINKNVLIYFHFIIKKRVRLFCPSTLFAKIVKR
jgi:hypothetical protein